MKALYFVVFIVVSFFASSAAATSIDDVTASLVADIKRAKAQLAREQDSITKQQDSLVSKVDKKGLEVAKLREQAASATRQQDDKLLDIKQLSARLNEWKTQANYQQQLLLDLNQAVRFQKQAEYGAEFSVKDSMTDLNQYILTQRAALNPVVQQQSVIMPDGEVVSAQTLTLGPLSWFYYAAASEAKSGLLDDASPLANVANVFTDAHHAQLVALFEQQNGAFLFDPTLEQLLKKEQTRESISDHLKKGGTWAVPILLFALIALCIGLVKAVMLLRLPKLLPLFGERLALLQQQEKATLELAKLSEQVQDAQLELIKITQKNPVSQQRDDQLFAFLLAYRHRLERGIGAIAIVASVAPLLGLLGTVSGMIETFRMMTLFGAGDPAAVSGGISEALVTTELGLIVAIPALILHAILNRRVKSRCLTLETQAIQLSQISDNPNQQPLTERAA